MKNWLNFPIILISMASVLSMFVLDACTKSPNNPADPQLLQIDYQYGFKSELNTFSGTFQKDLVMDGTVKVPFRLTASEQKTIVEKIQAINFFSFPDTLYRLTNVRVEPDPSPDFLKLKYQNEEKMVVWYYPQQVEESENYRHLKELTDAIEKIIESKPEYQKLPPARGG